MNGTDIMPKLCGLAGVPIPKDRVIDGTNIAPLFKGQELRRKIPAFWMFPARYFGFPYMAMREGDYVILGCVDEKAEDQTWMDFIKSAELKAFELYNLKKDLGQTENLVEKEPAVFFRSEDEDEGALGLGAGSSTAMGEL
jgi:arylsulfatase A